MNNTKSNTRKQYSAAFKAQIVLEALQEIKTVAQIASEHQLHPGITSSQGKPVEAPAFRHGE